MKNLCYLFAILFIVPLLLASCHKDGSDFNLQENQTKEVILNASDINGNTEQVKVVISPKDATLTTRSDHKTSVKGHFNSYYGEEDEFYWRQSTNASQEGDMVSGNVEMKTNFWGSFNGRVLCTYAEGNEAVVCAIITVAQDSMRTWLTEDAIVWYKVKDNGEGDEDPADQHWSGLYYLVNWSDEFETPEEYIASFPCSDAYNLNWDFTFPKDIEGGNIQVK